MAEIVNSSVEIDDGKGVKVRVDYAYDPEDTRNAVTAYAQRKALRAAVNALQDVFQKLGEDHKDMQAAKRGVVT